MNRFAKILLSLAAILVSSTQIHGQEVLTGLSTNKQIAREAKQPQQPLRVTPLHLPFVDDFSNYTGFPNPNLWQDRYAYVNRTFPIYPPTMGVATLDALNDLGVVYPYADGAGFDADMLTSQPIRLDYNFTANHNMQPGDSIYLSFYYQPGGGTLSGLEWERIGNQPEGRDSLILEFGYATGNIVFQGYTYCDYILGENESYVIGDTLENPYISNDYYIFEYAAFPGDVISIPCDSIMGEEMIWEHIWSTPGESLDSWLAENPLMYFKQVMIPITDPRWFINNFQFRFRNMASLEANGIVGWASNVDQWHIDYVRLETNRSADDLYPNDLGFVAPTTSILKNYQSMPWKQYRDSDLDNAFENVLANISNSVKNSYYTYYVSKVGGSQIAQYTTNNENARPYYDNGLHDAPGHANPAFTFTGLPHDNADSATFMVTHIFQEVGAGNQRRCNDTCVFEQKFSNYYAYDDGTAEAGYSILSTLTHPEAYLAMRFTLAQPDTLRSVRMWFNSVLEDENFADFSLMVWNDNNGLPGEIIYERENRLPAHAANYEDFVEYFIDTTLVVEGTFYVGFYQNHGVQLNLGFDQNTDSRAHFVYKTADTWREPFLKGTPMIRPVLDSPADLSPVHEIELAVCKVYPNPANSTLNISVSESFKPESYRIYDAFGRLVRNQSVSENSFSISVSDLQNGIYCIQMVAANGQTATQKFVVAK